LPSVAALRPALAALPLARTAAAVCGEEPDAAWLGRGDEARIGPGYLLSPAPDSQTPYELASGELRAEWPGVE
jgi:hypothetical protein